MSQFIAHLSQPLEAPRARRAVAAVAVAAALSGCSMIPAYERPAAPVAPQWPQGSSADGAALQVAAAAAAPDLPWQEFVLDERLRAVIALTLENNRDLRIAVKNIEQAQAQYRINRADLGPTVGASLSGSRWTDIFIYPGKEMRVVDALLTNFHLPKSSLLMMISAFAGIELIKNAYREAVLERYKFFSYENAMLIE